MNIKVVNQSISDSTKNYKIQHDGVNTSLGNVRVSESGETDCTVTVEVGGSLLVLSSDEAEHLATALLAHQHGVMGYEATIETTE
jgi:hypothetical protein